MNIVIFGPPAAGKGTQSSILVKKYDLFQLATGDVLRKAIADKTELGMRADAIIKRGDLVDDETILLIVKDMVSKMDSKNGVIFDGFPRTKAQAVGLDNMLAELGQKVDFVVELEVDPSILIDRVKKRFDETPADQRRADDNPETLKKRLDVYFSQTEEILGHYNKLGILEKVNGMLDIESVTKEIELIINKK